MAFASNALVYHEHHLTLRTFWRQHWNYGRGAYQFHRQRAVQQDGRVRLEPVRFYWRLLHYPFGREAAPWRITALLLVSQIVNAAGFFREKFSRTKKRA